jgi:hypothetical protein
MTLDGGRRGLLGVEVRLWLWAGCSEWWLRARLRWLRPRLREEMASDCWERDSIALGGRGTGL